jgi:hypothetical protein
MTLESIPTYIRRRALEGATLGDVAHELGVRVHVVMYAAAALGVTLGMGMHPGAYDGRVRESTPTQ